MEDRIKETCDKLYKLLAAANETGEKLVAIKNIPVEYLELVINALELKQKYEKQWIDDVSNPLEPLKLSSALNREIFKLEFRKDNKPEEINILDYTVIYALKDCLERYSGMRL